MGIRIDLLWALVAASLIFAVNSISSKMQIDLIDLSTTLIPYSTALDWQTLLMEKHIDMQKYNKKDTISTVGTLLMLQHPSVYTLGSGTTEASGPFGDVDAMTGTKLAFETTKVNRGGEATYHGPGQLIIYPILDLHYFGRDINSYLRKLESVTIDAVSGFGISAYSINDQPGYTGVWVDDAKIAAIGLKISRWVTMHGMSINVCPDMRYFRNIVPCGITDKAVGTLCQFATTTPANSNSNNKNNDNDNNNAVDASSTSSGRSSTGIDMNIDVECFAPVLLNSFLRHFDVEISSNDATSLSDESEVRRYMGKLQSRYQG